MNQPTLEVIFVLFCWKNNFSLIKINIRFLHFGAT